MNDLSTLIQARARADAARVRFRLAADDALGWLSPSRLRAQAAMAATHQIDEAKDALRRQMRHHPLVAWSALAVAATLLTYIVRKPAAALVRSARDGARAAYHQILKRKA